MCHVATIRDTFYRFKVTKVADTVPVYTERRAEAAAGRISRFRSLGFSSRAKAIFQGIELLFLATTMLFTAVSPTATRTAIVYTSADTFSDYHDLSECLSFLFLHTVL
jgi:hypothetical protein